MPLMTRKEIIEKYGFDPTETAQADQTSIFVKKSPEEFTSEEIEPITLDIKESIASPQDTTRTERDTKETPSTPILPMAASGAVRGFVSDPLVLAGMAVAGLEAAFTDKTFQESLYKEGGLEAVQKHLQEYADNLGEMDPEEKKRKIREYQASPEFFSFHTDQMGSLYGSGMKMAAAVNGMFGIAKTPEQETWQDDAAQIIGSILIPSPAIVAKAVAKLAAATGKATPRIAELAAKAVDATILPGTSSAQYTPGVLAASGAVGLGINELARGVADDPTITGGEAFTPRLPEGGFADPQSTDTSPRAWEVTSSLAALAAAAAGLSRAFRGKTDPTSLNPIKAGPDFDQQLKNNAEVMGMEPDTPQSIIRQLDNVVNVDAPLEQLARDAGNSAVEKAKAAGQIPTVTADTTEREVQTALGMYTSRPARDAKIQNFVERGETPDGQRTSISFRDITDYAQSIEQESVDRFRYGLVARNVADSRLKGLHASAEEVAKAQEAVDIAHRNRYSNTKIAELDEALQAKITAHNKALADDEAVRANMQGWDSSKIEKYQEDMMADPAARKLHDMAVRYNTELDQLGYRKGLISKETLEERLKTPWHTALFQARGVKYDPKLGREVIVDPHELNVIPNQVIDPFQNLSMRSAMLIDSIGFNDGKWRVINAIRASDTDGYYIREVGKAGRGTVTVLDQGRERHFKFSRESVAEALKFAPLSFSTPVQIANKGRHWFQRLTTGPWLGGIPTALNSLAYDVGAGYMARREGRAFGYLGMAARMSRYENQYLNTIADALDLPNAIVSTANQAVAATWYKTVGKLGESLMDAAVGKGAFQHALAYATPQDLRNLGARMTRAYERSTVGVLRRAGALQPHAMMTDTFGVKNRLERYITESMNAGRDIPNWKTTLRTVAEPYMALLDTVHNAGRYAFYANNHAILEHKYGRGNIPKAEIERLVEETRRLAGDIQATGGSQAYNTGAAFIPYGNIAAQATRHIYHAAFAQGSKHSFDVGVRLLGMATAGYASVKLAEEMGAGDWYWNTQNQFERVGSVLFPTPEAIVYRARNGEWPPFDPENPTQHFTRVRLAAELVPYIQTVLTGFEAFGLINRGTNLGKQTAGEDILNAVAGAANVGNIPIVNLVSILTGGPKLDFLNPLRGRPTGQDIKGPRGEGVFSGSLPSGIPVQLQEFAKSVAGFAGDIGIAMTDAAAQKFERSGNIFDSLMRAKDEGIHRYITTRMPSVPGLWKGEDKIYTSSPIGSRIKEVEALNKTLDEQYKMEFGNSQVRYPERPRVIDPEANAMLATTHAFLSKGSYKKLADHLAMTNAAIGQLDAGKARLSPEQIQIEKRKLLMTAREQQERLLSIIHTHETVLKEKFGPLFQRLGQPATIEGARKVLEMTTRKEKAPN